LVEAVEVRPGKAAEAKKTKAKAKENA